MRRERESTWVTVVTSQVKLEREETTSLKLRRGEVPFRRTVREVESRGPGDWMWEAREREACDGC